MVSAAKVLGLGLVGAAAGGALSTFGITPDLMGDALKDHVTALAGSNADVLTQAGIQVGTPDAVATLAESHHLVEHGDQVIAIAKDGVNAINVSGLQGGALEAAQALNAHFVEPSALTSAVQEFSTVTPDNQHAATEALSKIIGQEHAATLVQTALNAGGSLSETALSTIGSTPFEQSQFLSAAIPPAAGFAAGAGAGMLMNDDKPAVGQHTQKLLEQRRAAMTQAMSVV